MVENLMELTIEQKRANYLKEMQRDNNIVASDWSFLNK